MRRFHRLLVPWIPVALFALGAFALAGAGCDDYDRDSSAQNVREERDDPEPDPPPKQEKASSEPLTPLEQALQDFHEEEQKLQDLEAKADACRRDIERYEADGATATKEMAEMDAKHPPQTIIGLDGEPFTYIDYNKSDYQNRINGARRSASSAREELRGYEYRIKWAKERCDKARANVQQARTADQARANAARAAQNAVKTRPPAVRPPTSGGCAGH